VAGEGVQPRNFIAVNPFHKGIYPQRAVRRLSDERVARVKASKRKTGSFASIKCMRGFAVNEHATEPQ
jgi:hypothetical protein